MLILEICACQVAMECAGKLGCSESIIRFVLPLGTTVNMNGTALYEATTVIFIAQVWSIALPCCEHHARLTEKPYVPLNADVYVQPIWHIKVVTLAASPALVWHLSLQTSWQSNMCPAPESLLPYQGPCSFQHLLEHASSHTIDAAPTSD